MLILYHPLTGESKKKNRIDSETDNLDIHREIWLFDWEPQSEEDGKKAKRMTMKSLGQEKHETGYI